MPSISDKQQVGFLPNGVWLAIAAVTLGFSFMSERVAVFERYIGINAAASLLALFAVLFTMASEVLEGVQLRRANASIMVYISSVGLCLLGRFNEAAITALLFSLGELITRQMKRKVEQVPLALNAHEQEQLAKSSTLPAPSQQAKSRRAGSGSTRASYLLLINRYTLVVGVIAGLVALIAPLINHFTGLQLGGITTWFPRALPVLIVACPGALAVIEFYIPRRNTTLIVRICIVLTLLVKLIVMALAILGFLSTWMAVASDVLVIIVVLLLATKFA